MGWPIRGTARNAMAHVTMVDDRALVPAGVSPVRVVARCTGREIGYVATASQESHALVPRLAEATVGVSVEPLAAVTRLMDYTRMSLCHVWPSFVPCSDVKRVHLEGGIV